VLNAYALHELVLAICVSAPVKNSGKRVQPIRIKYYRLGFTQLDELMNGETA